MTVDSPPSGITTVRKVSKDSAAKTSSASSLMMFTATSVFTLEALTFASFAFVAAKMRSTSSSDAPVVSLSNHPREGARVSGVRLLKRNIVRSD
jgi:hypothetical protein